MNFFSFLCGVSLFVVVLANEYCYEDLCPGHEPHIACDYTGIFDQSCPDDATLIDMKPYKTKILNMLNGFRNTLAFGKLSGFSRAVRMATMTWDDELADLAAMNVQRCEMATDCHNTETYQYSGQTVYKQTSIRKGHIDKQIVRAIETWWNKNKITTMADINKFPEGKYEIDEFTCLASEMNMAVGCAISTFSSDMKVLLLTCNFANCNVYGKPIYVSGPTTSECTTGRNPKYHGLCSLDENYDINFEY